MPLDLESISRSNVKIGLCGQDVFMLFSDVGQVLLAVYAKSRMGPRWMGRQMAARIFFRIVSFREKKEERGGIIDL